MNTKHVLIIDDEDDIREVAQLTLEMVGGWRVSTTDSGRTGLVIAASEQPDAILLDVMMPEMDGLMTFQALKADAKTQDIPVILLTAKVQSAEQRRFAEVGATAMIAKPFNPMTLADQVAEILGWNN